MSGILPAGADPIITWAEDYTAPWRDEAVVAALPAGAWDGPVVRLARVIPGPPAVLVLQRARYFDYIGTNLSPHPCQRTDAIGIAAMLYTADGRCILQKRAERLAIRPGEIGPAMSGTLEPDDFIGVTRLSQLDLRREIREELSVTDAEIGPLHHLGLIRERQRHGAPELMLHGTLRLTAAVLAARATPEGTLLLVDPAEVPTLPRLSPPVDNLLWLMARRG